MSVKQYLSLEITQENLQAGKWNSKGPDHEMETDQAGTRRKMTSY